MLVMELKVADMQDRSQSFILVPDPGEVVDGCLHMFDAMVQNA